MSRSEQNCSSEFRDQIYQKYNITPLFTDVDKIPPESSILHILKTPSYSIGIIGINEVEKALALKHNLSAMIKSAKATEELKAIILLSQLPINDTTTIFSDAPDIDIIIQGQLSNMEPTAPKKLSPMGPLLIEGGRHGQFFTVLVLQNLKTRTSEELILDTRALEKDARKDLLLTRH